jgi:NTP pyrophosphatase (non-canonical NTP hydrolase)
MTSSPIAHGVMVSVDDPRPVHIRTEVMQFALAMELQLRANAHKPGWKKESVDDLLQRVQEELDELYDAVAPDTVRNVPLVLAEAADVANFLMMVCDVAGALDMRVLRDRVCGPFAGVLMYPADPG